MHVLTITLPHGDRFDGEWATIAGTAPLLRAQRIILFNWLPFYHNCYLQRNVVAPDFSGDWHSRSRLVAVDVERFIYALSVAPRHVQAVREVFEPSSTPSRLTPVEIEQDLQRIGVPFLISVPKLLIRTAS